MQHTEQLLRSEVRGTASIAERAVQRFRTATHRMRGLATIVRAVNKQVQCKLRDGIHADSQQTVVVYTDNKRGEMTAENRMSQLSQQWYKQHNPNQYWQLWRNRRTQRLGQIARRACVSHAAHQSDQPETTAEIDSPAAAKEDSSVVVNGSPYQRMQHWSSHGAATGEQLENRIAEVTRMQQWLLWSQHWWCIAQLRVSRRTACKSLTQE